MKREVISNGNDGPSQEILIFTKQIRHWILSDQVISGKRKLFFREDTPKEILDLYENIKSKLDFAYQEVHSNNGLKSVDFDHHKKTGNPVSNIYYRNSPLNTFTNIQKHNKGN